jgi:hypothetical protein
VTQRNTSILQAKADVGMSMAGYTALFEQVVQEGRTTGPNQSPDYVAYTKLNLARARRVEKTTKLQPELLDALRNTAPQTWLVLTEAWCGDAAQCVGVLAAAAQAAPEIEFKLLLRDEHPDLMDLYLTNGGRSIPKLIAIERSDDTTTAGTRELFTWGPRPQEAQELVLALRERHGDDWKAAAEELHRWYHSDATQSTQRELLALLGGA